MKANLRLRFGEFTGGGLDVETPEGLEHLTEKVFGISTTVDTHIGPNPSREIGGRL